jgi:F-type H+-transporting ATPase subunit gamma
MASLLDIKARIKLVGNIKKITRAMQLVAAAKFTRAQNRAKATRPYADELTGILGVLSGIIFGAQANASEDETTVSLSFIDGAAPIEAPRSKLFAPGEGVRPGVVLVTADRGLCGAFNTKLIREAQKFIRAHEGMDCKLITIGKKGYQFFRNKETPIIYHREGVSDKLLLDEIKEITSKLVELYVTDEVDSIHIIYTRFKTALSSTVTTDKFLSIPRVAGERSEELFILEPDIDSVFARLIPLYATTKIFSALSESFASEYGARMSAMQLATKNAEEMLQDLIILRNRLRQAIITKELAEIVGGAEALS